MIARCWEILLRFLGKRAIGRADLATLVMGYIAMVTFGTGFSYLLPTDTFALSPSFATLRALGGESLWGAILLLAGSHGFAAAWLEFMVVRIERDGSSNLQYSRIPSRIYGRIVWLMISSIWVFVGSSFACAVPYSPGAISYVSLGILTLIVSATARHRLKGGSEGG